MADNVQQLIDSLGRITEFSDKTGNALEALATAMTAQVKIMSSTSKPKSEANPAVDKFVELIEDKDNKIKEFSDYLKKELPDTFKQLTENIKEVNNHIKDTVNILEDIKNKSKSKTTAAPAGAPKTGNCDCQGALDKIADNIATINTTLTTGGMKLENKLYTVLNHINKRTGMMVKAIERIKVSSIDGSMDTVVSSSKTIPTPETEDNSLGSMLAETLEEGEDLGDILEDVVGKTSKMNRQLKDSPRWMRSLSYQSGRLTDEVGDMIDEINEGSLAWDISGESVDFLNRKWNKFARSVDNMPKDMGIANETKVKKVVSELADMVRQYRELKISAEQLAEAQNKAVKAIQNVDKWGRRGDVVAGMMMKSISNYSDKVFGGLVGNLNDWEKDATRMAATMTGAIHDAKGEFRDLVGEYRNLLKVSDEVIRQTHQFPAIVRKEWSKAIRKGTRNINETKEAINSALSAAWQVDATAESTADEFQKWNMYVGMSSTGSVSLARTMATVSKVTGVMGDNLLQAVNSAREIAQHMKDTGLYSQQTANSVVGWMASAQKFGIDKQVQNIFKAAQGGLEAFMEASSETKNLLAASGQLQNVMGGNADPEQVMAGVGDAIRDMLPANAFEKDAAGKPVGLPDLKKISKSERSVLDIIMKRRFGIKLGESVRLLETIQDQNPAEKLLKIQKDLENPVMTAAEKESLMLQKQQLEIARDEKNLTKIMDGMAEMSEAGKSEGATLNSMLEQGKMTEASFRQGISDSAQLLSQKMERQGKKFEDLQIKDESGKVLGEKQFSEKMNSLMQGMANGNKDSIRQFRDLQGQMANSNKTADSSAKNNSNMADKMETDQQRIQNGIQNMLKPLHTMAMQAGRLVWYSAMIVGAIWSLGRIWQRGRLAENMKLTAETLINTIGKKGSGWVHDPYVEHFVKNIDKNIVKLAKKMGVADATAAKAKKDKTDTSVNESLTDKIKNSLLDPIKEKFMGIVDPIKEKFTSIADPIKDKLSEKVGGALDSAKSKLGMGGDKVATAAQENLNKKKPTFNQEGQTVGEQFGASKDVSTKDKTSIAQDSLQNNINKQEVVSQKKESKLLSKDEKNTKKEANFLKKKEKSEMKIPGKAKGPKAELPSAKMEGGNAILEGAGKLAAVAAAVVALGVVLILAAKAIMALTGFDAKQAQEVSWVLGSVIGAGAATLLVAAGSAKVMEWASKAITMKNIKDIYLGALMLALVVPAIALLGVAMIGFAVLLSYMMSPQKAKEYANAAASIILSASIMAGAVLLSAVVLTGLGALTMLAVKSGMILPILALMGVGALTLIAFTPVMIALAGAVLYLAKGVMSVLGMDPKKAVEISNSVSDIMWSAAKIVGSVALSAVTLTAIGWMLPTIMFAIPFMIIGARTLFILTPAMMALASAVISLSKAVLSNVVNPEEAAKVSKSVADIMWSAGKIAGMVLLAVPVLTALSYLIYWSPILVPVMMAGAAALFMLTPAVLGMSLALINLTSKFANTINVKESAEVAKATSELLEASFKIAKAVVEGKVYISSLGAMSIFAWLLSPPLDAGAKALMAMSDSMFRITQSIIYISHKLLSEYNAKEGVKVAQEAAEVMSSIGKVVESLSNTITALNTKLAPLISSSGFMGMGPSIVQKLDKMIPLFGDYFKSIAASLSDGIVKPIVLGFPEKTKVDGAIDQIKGLLDILDALPKFLNDLSVKMTALVNAKSLSTNLGSRTQGFAMWFKSIGDAITDGIINPVKNFPNIDEINKATNTLNVLVQALEGIAEAMGSLQELMAKMSALEIDFSALENVGAIFKSGELKLVVQAKDTDTSVGETSEAQSWREGLLGVFTGNRSPAVSKNSKFLHGMSQGIGVTVEKPMTSVATATGKVGTGIGKLDGTMSKISTSQGDIPIKLDVIHSDLVAINAQLKTAQAPVMPVDDIRNLTQSINKINDSVLMTSNIIHASSLAILIQLKAIEKSVDKAVTGVSNINAVIEQLKLVEKAITGISNANAIIEQLKLIERAIVNLGAMPVRTTVNDIDSSNALVSASNALNSLEHEATSGASLDTHDHTVESLMLNKVLPYLEQVMNATTAQEEVAVKTSINQNDFDKQVQARVEQARPSDAMMNSMEYLAAIAVSTAATNESVQDAVDVLEDIKRMMTTTAGQGVGSGEINTVGPKKPRSSPNYYTWQYGKFGDTASKQYTNPGY